MTHPGLICDHMLERLARWLRMAGYDTILPGEMDDDGIHELSRTTGRVLLTRDKDLSNRKGIITLRIHSDDLDQQLAELLKAIPPSERDLTRCPLCNGGLALVDAMDVGTDIPAAVRLSHNEFYRCHSCGKTYWSGSHWERIVSKLRSAGIHPTLPTGPQGKSNKGP
jgi:uncharacterized protein with PIN domain